MKTKNYDRDLIKMFFMFILIFFIVIPSLLFVTGKLLYEIDSERILKEHGVKMSSSEYECYDLCGQNNYLYKPPTTEKQMLCECKREFIKEIQNR